MNKHEVRLVIRDRICVMSREEKIKESETLCERLIAFLSTQEFDTLITYDPLHDEVDIGAITKWARKIGKNVVIIDQKDQLKATLSRGVVADRGVVGIVP